MSNWLHFGHDVQRTSADPDGNISTLVEKWARHAGGDSKNGWAGGAIADSSSIYHFYSSYSSTIGGTGDRFAMNKYDTNGNLQWSNKALGGHNTRKMWPAMIGDYIQFHDWKYLRINPFTGATAGGYFSGDTYGTIATNAAVTKHFSPRVACNEGFQGFIWVRGWDSTVAPNLSNNQALLWERNAATTGQQAIMDQNKFSIAYDNNKIFYAPNYRVPVTVTVPWPYSNGIYCWDDNGTLQWSVVTTPSRETAISTGNNLLYLFEDPSSLVARNQSNGTVSWSVVISGTPKKAQPPVLANGMVIIATSTGVHAYNATTGASVWSNAIPDLDFADPNHNLLYTCLAAALASNTLVVTAKAGVYILDMTDGSQIQLYNPPSVVSAGTGSFLASPARPVNPIIVGNRVYVTITYDNFSTYYPLVVVCLENTSVPPSDVIPPSTPGNPTFSSVTTSSMTVSWVASTDNVAVNYYNLFWKHSASSTWNSIIKTSTSHNFTGLSASTTYQFYVNAVDTSGNTSSDSATTSQATSANPVDSTPPSTPGDPTFNNVTTSSINVSWTASTDNVAVSYYRLYYRIAGGNWDVINKTGTSHNFTGLLSDTTYEFYVNAVDTSGNSSADSNTNSQATLAVPPPDTTPPSAPGNPTFSSITASGMTVSWAPSTDNVAVASYRLYWRQEGLSWNAIDKGTTSHTFTGLIENTNYEFYVTATDTSGNVSMPSGTTSQTTDTLPVFVQLSGATSINSATGQRSIHNLNWNTASGSIVLQRRTQKTSWTTIYSGEPPYSYAQTDLNTNYYYRLVVDGTTFSNEVVLRSTRK